MLGDDFLGNRENSTFDNFPVEISIFGMFFYLENPKNGKMAIFVSSIDTQLKRGTAKATMTTPWEMIEEGARRYIEAVLGVTAAQFNGPSYDRVNVLQMYYKHAEAVKTEKLAKSLVYSFGGKNGVDPNRFRDREVVGNMLSELPENVQSWSDDNATLRIQLSGPPGSGKTSIMGKIDQSVRQRYPDTKVLFVRGAEHKLQKDDIHQIILGEEKCVVLVDDAHLWYGLDDFWALFKGAERLLIFAATYSVRQLNPSIAVNPQSQHATYLLPEELSALIASFGVVEQSHREGLKIWFGNIYGFYHVLVPALLTRWEGMKRQNPTATLADAFFRADTLDDTHGRFLPDLSSEMRNLLLEAWMGQVSSAQREKLRQYGVFDEDGIQWSCEYVRRKYFDDLFHHPIMVTHLFDDGLPSELDLLKAGLERIKWRRLKQNTGSSTTGFPIEDIWQAEFYASIGEVIPKGLVFCKEYVANPSAKVDFVLRNDSTRAIEFLIKSSDVGGHHQRFESGAYNSLRLSGSYLVVDIKPWDNKPDLYDVSEARRVQAARACFDALGTTTRLMHHALFMISNDLLSGILYAFDSETGAVFECLRSPGT
mmetsp:Transcript_28385/g.77915  ORF Transcript_28385/g.77915 Transcript_28385/m.77915 type:complete len:595 (-) Transcript_28385:2815-4599(-)